MRTGTRLVLTTGLALVATWLAVEGAARAMLHRLRSTRRKDVADYREHLSLPRPVSYGSPVSQNGAYWYRRALTLAQITLTRPDKTVLARDVDDLAALRARLSDRCVGVELVLEGAQCTYVDWDLAFERAEAMDGDVDILSARLLGFCVVEEATRRAERADGTGAASAYLADLRFAADIRLTNLVGTLIAIDVARIALAGLGEWISTSHTRDRVDLASIDTKLATLAPVVLDLGESPRVDRLEQFGLVAAEAAEQARQHSAMGRLFPWNAVTAWRLYQVDRILREVEATATASDAAASRLADDASDRAGHSWSSLLRLSLSGQMGWQSVRRDAEELQDRYVMVRSAVFLEDWYQRHGAYPESLRSVLSDATNVRYEPYDGYQGYRLRLLTEERPSVRKSARLRLERRPRGGR